jgi:hypothetical protein
MRALVKENKGSAVNVRHLLCGEITQRQIATPWNEEGRTHADVGEIKLAGPVRSEELTQKTVAS